jgi:hypothetical protein
MAILEEMYTKVKQDSQASNVADSTYRPFPNTNHYSSLCPICNPKCPHGYKADSVFAPYITWTSQGSKLT